MTVRDSARKLIRNAYVDGGHCLDAVTVGDMEDLVGALAARTHLRGPIEATAADFARGWKPGAGINWSRLERMHRAVLATWPDLHADEIPLAMNTRRG